jgi:Trk K+ transport system NAD-binding subunit
MRLNSFIPGLDGETGEQSVTGFAIDHRKVAPGTVFGAFRGARVNGEDFVAQAFIGQPRRGLRAQNRVRIPARLIELGGEEIELVGEILGAAMAARTFGLAGDSHVIGEFAGLQIAEASPMGTELLGRTLGEVQLRKRLGVSIIGVWRRGTFSVATADTVLTDSSMLILAGTADQIGAYDECYATHSPTDNRAVIIGGGRVGRAVGAAFAGAGIEFVIVEQMPERQRDGANYVIGDAADRAVLEEAGLAEAAAVLRGENPDIHAPTPVAIARILLEAWVAEA